MKKKSLQIIELLSKGVVGSHRHPEDQTTES